MIAKEKRILTDAHKQTLQEYLVEKVGVSKEVAAKWLEERWDSHKNVNKVTLANGVRMKSTQRNTIIRYLLKRGYSINWVADCIGTKPRNIHTILERQQ